jgi:hypothetical protein
MKALLSNRDSIRDLEVCHARSGFSPRHLCAIKRHEQVQQVPGNQLTYLGGYTLGTPSHLLGSGLPDGRRPLRFLSLEDPTGRLRQMISHGARRNGMSLAPGDLVVDLAHVLGLPGRVIWRGAQRTQSPQWSG